MESTLLFLPAKDPSFIDQLEDSNTSEKLDLLNQRVKVTFIFNISFELFVQVNRFKWKITKNLEVIDD
jgi:hypothetical protein